MYIWRSFFGLYFSFINELKSWITLEQFFYFFFSEPSYKCSFSAALTKCLGAEIRLFLFVEPEPKFEGGSNFDLTQKRLEKTEIKYQSTNLSEQIYHLESILEIKSHLHNWNRKRTRLLNRGRKTRGGGNNCQRVPWFSFYRAGQKCAPDWSQSCKRIETNSSLFTSQLCKVSFRILKASFAKHEFWHNKEHFFAKYETRCAWYSREFCTEETRVACFCDYLMFTVVYFNLFWVL